jgi:hypothetical protein
MMRSFRSRRSGATPPAPSPELPLDLNNSSLYPDNSLDTSATFRYSRTPSFPDPPSSVEPPQIGAYTYIASPAPQPTLSIISENETQPAELQHLGASTGGPAIPTQSVKPKRQLPFAMDPLKPAPPKDVTREVQRTRLGTNVNIPDEIYEMDLEPPVRRRSPPQAIYIDFGVSEQTDINNSTWVSNDTRSERPGLAQQHDQTRPATPGPSNLHPPIGQPPMSSPGLISSADADSSLNTSTWVLSPAEPGLVPPVDQKPMTTPGAPSLVPPISQPPMSSPGAVPGSLMRSAYDTQRPTCSLNIVCYRGGSKGCILRQIQTALKSRFPNEDGFKSTMSKNPHLIAGDQEFFYELRRLYWGEMCGFWRKYLSLKTLTGLRLLAVR